MHLKSNHKTAILVFAYSSKEEIANKSINNGLQLFDTLTNQVLKTASKTKLPFYHYSGEQQKGNTFGERFTNAIQKVFEKGYEQVIAIGNDTPHLTAAHILEAEKQLSTNKSVLGPSADGGFYLLGLHKSQFDQNTFKQLAWQTSDLSKQVLTFIDQENTKVFKLPTLLDIDTKRDVKSIISYTSSISKKLLLVLLNAVGRQKNEYSSSLQGFQSLVSSIRYNKGSPQLISL